MIDVQYRIGTVSFRDEVRPTWGTRSTQILEEMARWGREGWRISRLHASPCIRLRAKGFCLLLERPLPKCAESRFRRRDSRGRPFAA